MRYRRLGRTDTEISLICLGSMTWGEQNTEAEAHAQLDAAVAAGVNFIDTAEMYPIPPRAATCGLTERYIGSWLRRRGGRDRLVLASAKVSDCWPIRPWASAYSQASTWTASAPRARA